MFDYKKQLVEIFEKDDSPLLKVTSKNVIISEKQKLIDIFLEINDFIDVNNREPCSNDNISEILFITSPFHTLRTKLIWNKNVPNVDIYFPKTYEAEKKKKIKLFSPLKDIYVILYEYLSITYNYLINRL